MSPALSFSHSSPLLSYFYPVLSFGCRNKRSVIVFVIVVVIVVTVLIYHFFNNTINEYWR